MSKIITSEYLQRGRAYVRRVGLESVIKLLADCANEWDRTMRFTRWEGGLHATTHGQAGKLGAGERIEIPFEEFVEGLKSYAASLIPKREGLVVAHAMSSYSGSSDAECVAVTGLFADADEVGDWTRLCAVLERAGFAFVIDESSSSTLDSRRFHLVVPLAKPLVPPAGDPRDKVCAAWKENVYAAQYGWMLGIFSELAELEPNSGFDPMTNRLIQPTLPGCRQSDGARVPEIRWASGLALEWDQFLAATGYVPPKQKTRSPSPKSTASGGLPPSGRTTGGDFALVRAFAEDGLVVRYRGKNTVVVCPWERLHSSGTRGDTSTVIMHQSPYGLFVCSHTHCVSRTQAEVERTLSGNAHRVMEEARNQHGIVRLRDQLQEQGIVAQSSTKTTLEGVEQDLADVLRDVKSGGLVVVVLAPGAGKSRAALRALAALGVGIVASPTHQIADEQEATLVALGRNPHRGRGVLRVLDSAGNRACKRADGAMEIQRVGGSVPMLVCGPCPDRKGCPARKGQGGGDVAVVQHQQLPAARAHRPGALVVIDESPALYTEMVLTPAQLAEARQLVADDDFWESLDAEFRGAMRLWVNVIVTAKALDMRLEDAAAQFFFSPHGKKLFDASEALIAKAPMWSGNVKSGTGLVRLVVNLVVTFSRPRTEAIAAADSGRPLAVATVSESTMQRAVGVLRLLRPLRVLAQQVQQSGECAALHWRGEDLVVKALTPVAEDIIANGGVLLDATPDLHALRALRRDLREIRLDVPDGAAIGRTVVYQSGASRRGLLPMTRPDWPRFHRILESVLNRARTAGVEKLLIVTYKAIADAIAKTGSPCADLLDGWRRQNRVVEFAHYGGARGVNRWETFDGCISIGDPWPPVIQQQERAVDLGIDPDTYLRSFAARELEQAHGRLRAPSRSKPAHLIHVGTVAPSGWTDATTEVVTTTAGRPKTTVVVSAGAVSELVDALGGPEGAATKVGCSAKTLRRYCSGERAAPDAVVTLLRRFAGQGRDAA